MFRSRWIASALLSVLTGAGFVALGNEAKAMVIDARSTTLLAGRQVPVDGEGRTVVPLYEMLTLTIDDAFKVEGWVDETSATLSAWGQVDPAADADSRTFRGDLTLAYVEARLFERLRVRLGRQLIIGGATRMLALDGLSTDVAIAGGLGLSAYAGMPVAHRFLTDPGDFATGARLYWRRDFNKELGASFVFALDQGREARRDVGFDGRWSPSKDLTLTGHLVLSTLDVRLADAALMGAWQVSRSLEISAGYKHTAPDLFLSYNSLFRVFTEETRNELGGGFYYRPWQDLGMSADYFYVFDQGFSGHRADLRLNVYFNRTRADTAGAEIKLLFNEDGTFNDGYAYGRFFARYRILRGVTLAGDVGATFLNQSINGESQSVVGTLVAAYRLGDVWDVAVSGLVGSTPFAAYRVEAMARLIYNGTYRFSEVR